MKQPLHPRGLAGILISEHGAEHQVSGDMASKHLASQITLGLMAESCARGDRI